MNIDKSVHSSFRIISAPSAHAGKPAEIVLLELKFAPLME